MLTSKILNYIGLNLCHYISDGYLMLCFSKNKISHLFECMCALLWIMNSKVTFLNTVAHPDRRKHWSAGSRSLLVVYFFLSFFFATQQFVRLCILTPSQLREMCRKHLRQTDTISLSLSLSQIFIGSHLATAMDTH